jgi:AcrR family transcriptional regulator
MGRGRHAGYEDQRGAILARAAHLFAVRGYSATSMNEVAEACGLSKPTLYHYYRDKYALLFSIADTHVGRLQRIAAEAEPALSQPHERLRALIRRLVEEYADAQDAHWVLTSEVRFLEPADRRLVLDREREVVAAFAEVVGALRPDLRGRALDKPLTMLLFGMVNWMFTWMKPGGVLDHEAMAPIVTDLFLGGLAAVKDPGDLRGLAPRAGSTPAAARRSSPATRRGVPTPET